MAIFRTVPPAAASDMAALANFAYDEGVGLKGLFGNSGWHALGGANLGIDSRFFDSKGACCEIAFYGCDVSCGTTLRCLTSSG